MSSQPARRYRGYLEPGQPCRIPKQTAYNQRRKKARQVNVNDDDDDSSDVVGGHRMDDSDDSADFRNSSCETAEDEVAPDDDDRQDDFDIHGEDDGADPPNSSESSDGDSSDSSTLNDDDVKSYFEKCSTETLPNQSVTKAQALLLILSYVVHAGLSWCQVEGLLKLVNTLCGSDVVPDTKYLFRKLWQDRMNSLQMHFFCPNCLGYLGVRTTKSRSQSFVCSTCQASYSMQPLISKGNFFLVFDLKRQLYDIIARHAQDLFETLKKVPSVAYGVYTDITNGRMYRSIRHRLNMKWCDITVTLNSDGSPVFKSNKSSVWPIQLLLNELPFNVRFQEVLVGALWFGNHHPPVHLFMKTFVEVFNKIGSICWIHNGNTMSSQVYASCCCVDSPARAAILNMKQFNGYFGCSWCLDEGTVVDGVLRYIPGTSPAPARTHRGMLKDMQDAYHRGEPVHGVKGLSPLIRLKGFNLVWCVPPDIMHCVLEGVTRQLLELWLSATGKPYYIGRHIKELDCAIIKLRPPITFCRLPRPLSDRSHWKATEWLYWLLFYSLPCLKAVLPATYLAHFGMLCEAVYLLMQTAVTEADLDKANELLSSFVKRVYVLYGASASTFNVHQLFHITKSVEMLGPLWGISTFPFENGNGQLLKFVKAAQGVPLQIAEHCIMKSWLKTAEKFVKLPPVLQHRKNSITNVHPSTGNKVQVLGAPLLSMELQSSVEELFVTKYGSVPSMTHYARLLLKEMKIHTTSYTRAMKTYSSCVKMNDGHYCLVTDICSVLLDRRRIVLVCEDLIIGECTFRHVGYIRKCYRPPRGRKLSLYAEEDVSAQCVFLQDCDTSYVCDIPNRCKID